ncbi:G-protein coupled receptor Mth2-like isoform X6 [Coccinella septempunctata]|uniref:G-protein coupled receptor Mth2-like isoform X6 n=1 Tax=Coccinella septempunctata TaxID=41139 RepID=UPI001D09084F|nr:G-protein coupled receptor Mth2-like isoform X6 [Coccinella septempunctata]
MNIRPKSVEIFIDLLIWHIYSVVVFCESPQHFSNSVHVSRNYTSVKKCCPEDFIFNETCVNKNSSVALMIPIYDGKIPVVNLTDISQISIANSKNIKRCDSIAIHKKFFIQFDGSLRVPIHWNVWYFEADEFCVEYDGFGELVAYVCGDSQRPIFDILRSVGMIISMPFLLVTFLVYALLPDRNLHMKALMCYVINLLHAYIFLVTIQLTDEVFEDTVCAILGYCCVFFFLASFFWMNVICVDIFLGFRGFRGVPGVRSSERKRFILYCIYAWGMSLLIVFITFMVNHFGNVGQWFYPGVAVGQCFIRNGIPQLLYFYGPMGIIIILNVVLFTLTAMRIRRVKKDTAMLKHSESKRHSDDDQQNFNLYLKLLLAMGVNWSMELVSWAVNLNNKAVPQYVWYLSDFCNATYGVFIFFIFVFKRNIWKQLRRRYYSFMGRHHMAHSMGTTNFTKTTNDSMTVSTNDRALEESELNGTRIN